MRHIIMKCKLLIVDPLAERGHKNFDTFFLHVFSEIFEVEFMTKDNYLKENEKYKTHGFNYKKGTKNRGTFFFRYSQYRYIKESIHYFQKKGFDYIIFLSYETISMSLALNTSSKLPVLLFEHNNIDQLLTSSIKSFFYKMIPKYALHIVYETYISNFIKVTYSKSTAVVNHPHYLKNKIEKNDVNNKDQLTIFAPSSTYNDEILEYLIRYSKQNNYMLISKGPKEISEENLIISPFFNNYDDLMKQSDFIFITNTFNYRVSGVLYEALGNHKRVLGMQCKYLSEMQKRYPLLIKAINNFEENKLLTKNHDSNIDEEFIKYQELHSFKGVQKQIAMIIGASCNE